MQFWITYSFLQFFIILAEAKLLIKDGPVVWRRVQQDDLYGRPL